MINFFQYILTESYSHYQYFRSSYRVFSSSTHLIYVLILALIKKEKYIHYTLIYFTIGKILVNLFFYLYFYMNTILIANKLEKHALLYWGVYLFNSIPLQSCLKKRNCERIKRNALSLSIRAGRATISFAIKLSIKLISRMHVRNSSNSRNIVRAIVTTHKQCKLIGWYGGHVKVAESRFPYFTRIFRKVHFADHVDAIG